MHRSLGVHLSFVRSVGMDSWNAVQLKKMQLGGNAKVNQFLAKHGVPKDAPIHLKYNSAAAEAFREKIRVEAEGGKYVEPANIQKGLKQNTGETPAHQRTGFENGQTLGSSKGTTGMGSRSSQNDLQRGGRVAAAVVVVIIVVIIIAILIQTIGRSIPWRKWKRQRRGKRRSLRSNRQETRQNRKVSRRAKAGNSSALGRNHRPGKIRAARATMC